jgi:aerobic-type carbon monoxide dehydrogenase small subunit (CoxS/CutS family)
MIAAATELLAANPAPSREEIREALAGNLCMCTGYVGIVRAVELAATPRPLPMAPAPGAPAPESAS